MKKIIGEKLKMTQVWKNDIVVPVSIIRIKEDSDFSDLKEGVLVKVSGLNKGHGFQGTVKRHGFSGGPKTHGQKNRFRAPGSIGHTAPQRVIKGKRMAGRMGQERITVKNLKVVEVIADTRELFLRGAVPGSKGGKIEVYYEN